MVSALLVFGEQGEGRDGNEMIDFLMISTRSTRRGTIEIYPKFIIKKSSDLMIRGGDFYAIWIEEQGMWSTNEQDALMIIDRELDRYAEENKSRFDSDVRVLHMWDSDSGMIDRWYKYCQRQMRDNFRMLDEKLIFANTKTKKEDYASKRLPYALAEGSMEGYDRLMSVLYSPEERLKIEWAIGAVVSGDSKEIQKFMVFYGSVGTGKSTVLNIIHKLFDCYTTVFDAKAIGSPNNAFALEVFRTNPLVAIQHDGDLSRIEDNTRLNSLVSHEMMTVNEKFRSAYSNRFKCFLFIGTNKPVKITDAKSGLIRRLIDVSPSGKKLSGREYKDIMEKIPFELGAIASHCLKVYEENKDRYENYIPTSMLGATNDFYNFVLDSYHVFSREDGTTLKSAWEMYKTYCDEAKVNFPYSQRLFKEELKNYFRDFKERFRCEDDSRVRSYYSGFRKDKFEERSEEETDVSTYSIDFSETKSILDKDLALCPAQYATEKEEIPMYKWEKVKTNLSDIDTGRLHYLKPPENHIVVDFDLKDEKGEKSFEKNLTEASKFPPTYAELSKSGGGIHLHYIYAGDVTQLNPIYDKNIEIKTFTGGSSLRRRLTKCNSLPIAVISGGLPLKSKGGKMINFEGVKNEKHLRTQIKKNLNKEYHGYTKPSVDFIYKILEDAYNSGLNYDVSDMRPAVLAFAAGSTNQSETCIKLVNKMKFSSADISENKDSDKKLVFFDVEVFPNLFLVNWKYQGEDKKVVRMINPTPEDIEVLLQFRLVGFNCRRYDNHILYARLMGYTNEQLFNLSQKIINGSPDCFFGEAYNISYTDVYDFSSKKQSLKKFEIELGIHHKELGLPWDKPVPEDMWVKVAEYCDNDVLATEAVFNARQADFTARQILADVAGMSVNDTTNSLTTRIIFGKERKPQSKFNYRDMSAPCDDKPYFEGYVFDGKKSTYKGEEVGEGGYVYSEPGIYENVSLLDIASMHPSSIVAENLFGDEYTQRFKEILDARIAIKHGDFEKARKMLGGKLAKYLTDEKTAKDLAQALKIAINSVYGLTAANFDNPFRDIRNKDNIVAKRGALFMINLKHEVQKYGFTVAHIKTDSIKIPDATPEIIKFVMDYGKHYGYNFEHEDTYDKMCLVNDAVYIARNEVGEWTATGTQFAVPYVFKTLFSKEDIEFKDLCETKSVSKGALYLDMNENLPDVSEYEKELSKALEKYRKGLLSDTTFEPMAAKLREKIAQGHNYIFVGRVGQFCPIKSGCGGGLLMREQDGRYFAVSGTKGYRFLESEVVKSLEKENDIDRSYYERLAKEAKETISKYGDFEEFLKDSLPF